MAQIFHARANTIARVTLVGIVVILGAVSWFAYAWPRSNYKTRVHLAIDQPVPFSHQHHVAGLGIDCRYCHTTVEVSPFAGIPPTGTCMNCHSQIWADAPLLAPVRESWRTGRPLRWNRVHDLPDYVYFNHAIHVNKGVGCSTCHGRVDQMPLTWKNQTLQMEWCLDCHRQPEKYLRPLEEIFDLDWTPPKD